PSVSRNSKIGWFPGNSTRTPTTRISLIGLRLPTSCAGHSTVATTRTNRTSHAGPHQRRYPSLWRCARCLISTDLPSANPHTILRHAPRSVAQLHRPRAGSTEFLTHQVVTGHMPTGTTDRCEITENATGSPPLGTTGQPYIAAVATEQSPVTSPLPLVSILRARQEHRPELADLAIV